jgi:hypothetical protein
MRFTNTGQIIDTTTKEETETISRVREEVAKNHSTDSNKATLSVPSTFQPVFNFVYDENVQKIATLGVIAGVCFAPEIAIALGPKLANNDNASKALAIIPQAGLNIGKHTLLRMEERGITPQMAKAAIDKGISFWNEKNKAVTYILKEGFASGKGLVVGKNPISQKITTVIRVDAKEALRMIRKLSE